MKNIRYQIGMIVFMLMLFVYTVAKFSYKNTSFTISTDTFEEDIEELYLDHATQEDITEAGRQHGLKRLHITTISDNIDLSPISNLTELEELTLNTYGREIDSRSLGELKQLSSFSMENALFDLSFIAKLSNLREITIQRSEVEDLSVFAGLTKLRNLNIEYATDTDLQYLEKLTDLQELHICGGHIRNMEIIKNLGHLKELYLYENTDIYDEQPKAEIVFLSDLNELECIMITHMDIDNMEFFSEIKSLKWIGLVDTGMNDIMPLKKLKNLEYLGIYGNHSEEVKNQAEQYFKNIDGLSVEVSEKIPVAL